MKRHNEDDDEPVTTPEWMLHLLIVMGFGLDALGITKLLGLW